MVRVEYINYCGYVLESENAVYIFDYVEGNIPSRYLNTKKPVLFFVSRFNERHYSTSVFNYKKTVVLSDEVPVAPYRDVFVVGQGDCLNLGFAQVYALETTSEGLSFVVQEREHTYFYGGCLNDWHYKHNSSINDARKATASFTEKLQKVFAFGPFDVIIFPVDARIGKDYDQGARAIIERLHPKAFFPTHLETHTKIRDFIEWGNSIASTQIEVPKHDNKYYELQI